MKKFLFLLLSGIVCLQVTAQLGSDSTSSKKKKKTEHAFYATAGVNFAGINGDSDSYDEMLPGFHAGVGIRLVELNDIFGIRSELMYSAQGSKYNDTYASGKVMLNYIALPILIRAGTPSGFYGEAGVQPAFLLSAKDKYEGRTDDYKDYVNGFDFGGLLGAGFEKNQFGIGARLVNGFSNINKEGNDKDHNFVISLRATFAF